MDKNSRFDRAFDTCGHMLLPPIPIELRIPLIEHKTAENSIKLSMQVESDNSFKNYGLDVLGRGRGLS